MIHTDGTPTIASGVSRKPARHIKPGCEEYVARQDARRFDAGEIGVIDDPLSEARLWTNHGIDTLLHVAKAWASRDDWNVKSIYVGSIADLAAALQAGDDSAALIRHAKHLAKDCVKHSCATRIPSYMAHR